MSIVNTLHLDLEKVLYALFLNVNFKSEAAKRTAQSIKQHDNRESGTIGVYRNPDLYLDFPMLLKKCIKRMPSGKFYLGNLGPVKFNIWFYPEDIELDLTQYDLVHKTNATEGVLTAKACIEQLKLTHKEYLLIPEALEQTTGGHFKVPFSIDFADSCVPTHHNQLECRIPTSNPNSKIVIGINENVTASWVDIAKDTYSDCDAFQRPVSDLSPTFFVRCVGKQTHFTQRERFVETPIPKLKFAQAPSTLSTLGSAAVYNATYAAFTEAVGDAFYLTGLLSKTNSERVKTATNLMCIYISGSWLSAGAALTTNAVLQKVGCSESNSRLGGQAVGVAVQLGQSLTPIGAANTIVGFASGKLGLWAEQKVVEKLTGTNEDTQISKTM